MGLFSGKSRQEREIEKVQAQAQLEQIRHSVADKYESMVTAALERLTRWAFPDSVVEEPRAGVWQLWHTTAAGEKHVDVVVELEFDDDEVDEDTLCLSCTHSWQDGDSEYECTPPLTAEDLDHALRCCICAE